MDSGRASANSGQGPQAQAGAADLLQRPVATTVVLDTERCGSGNEADRKIPIRSVWTPPTPTAITATSMSGW
jgi:hypothetical protein